jgi:hypothetical protein
MPAASRARRTSLPKWCMGDAPGSESVPVEVLLAEPEALGDDVFEACLYLM